MKEEDKNTFAGMLMSTYGIQISPDNELLPVLYIAYAIELQIGTSTKEYAQTLKNGQAEITEVSKVVKEGGKNYKDVLDEFTNLVKQQQTILEQNKIVQKNMEDLMDRYLVISRHQSMITKGLEKFYEETKLDRSVFIDGLERMEKERAAMEENNKKPQNGIFKKVFDSLSNKPNKA